MNSPTKSAVTTCAVRGVPAMVAAAALALSVAACTPAGSTAASSGGAAGQAASVPSLPVDAAAVALLPASIKSAKVLRVAIPTNEPPTQYYRTGTHDLTGVNPDVARLIGEALGVKVDIQVANFDSIIPGIAAGRYDMTVSSMTPTAERMKVLDFVDYMQIGSTVAVAKGNPQGLTENSLCGKKVGLLTGSYQLTVDVPTFDKACSTAGKRKIQVNAFQDTRQAISALTSARLDAVLADSPILNFAATQNPQIDIASKYAFTPVGVGLTKQDGLVKSVSAALAAVIKSDAYVKVLGTYGLQSSAITDARVNFAQ